MDLRLQGVLFALLAACSARGGGGGIPMDLDASDGGDELAMDTALPDTALPDTTLPDTALPDTRRPDTAAPDTAVPDTGPEDTGRPDTARPDTELPDGDGVCPATCASHGDCERCWRSGETRVGSYCCAANLCIYRPEMSCSAVTDSGVPVPDLPDSGDIAGGS